MAALKEHIVKLPDGRYRLLSHKGKSLGTFRSREQAAEHEKQVNYFKAMKAGVLKHESDEILTFEQFQRFQKLGEMVTESQKLGLYDDQ